MIITVNIRFRCTARFGNTIYKFLHIKKINNFFIGGGGDGNRLVTVTVTDAQRNESGLVRQIVSPKYRGAIIVCGGADDPVVCLAIKDAVSNATGLGTDRISVLKMN